jgi:hypothetical protein
MGLEGSLAPEQIPAPLAPTLIGLE